MIIMVIFPQINFGLFYGIRLLKRFLDSGIECCNSKDRKSKKKSMAQYVDLYAGPEIQMFFRYASVINIVFVAMTHGVALPILYPLALFGLANNYFTERILLAYYYRKPPLLG